MPRLRRAKVGASGIARRRVGRGFCYFTPDGDRISDPEVLDRISGLVIPPAWTDVWICQYPNGHIQAAGTDAAGRRQYLYHPAWREQRDREKFDRVLDFADRLPHVRDRVVATLEDDTGFSKERVLAAALRLLDLGFFRIGGEQYAEENGTYGLATIRKEHVRVAVSGLITFDYPAKHGKQRVQAVADELVWDIVAGLRRRRGGGDELLAWQDAAGQWVDVRSSDVNDYLRAIAAMACSAKDFRTWSATVLAAVGLAVSLPSSQSPTARKRAVARAVKEVADYLGNTPAVCRSSYIDPRVIDLYEDGITIIDDLDALGDEARQGEMATQGAIEQAVLAMLRDPAAARRRLANRRSPARRAG
ncbi:MAG: DNA topoisomerase IB [Frankiaceae bacterium]